MTIPPVPQTGRTSPTAGDRLLRQNHPHDQRDMFATDPNREIKQLGRVALRRTEPDDYFALGDLCARQSITPHDRLLIFYVGKTLTAYRRALKHAQTNVDRAAAIRAIDLYTDWLIDVARINPLRKNVAVVLWALAGDEEMDEETALLEEGTSIDVQLINEMLTAYRGGASGELLPGSGAQPLQPTVVEEHTVAYSDSPMGISDATAADMTRADSALPIPLDEDSNVSETRVDDARRLDLISIDELPRQPLQRSTAKPVHRRPHTRDDSDAFDVGDVIGDRYEVVLVKRGGMGVVYLCYDRNEREAVALKTFQTKFLENDRAVKRFMQEALTWVRLEKHRYIVAARLVQNIGGQPYIILEHISGPDGLEADLRSWIDHKRLNIQQSLEFGLHIALGMQHATQRVPGLVHRDLKPANILVTHERIAKVTDFGLVRSLEAEEVTFLTEDEAAPASERLTRVGAIIGTAPYMSPEQCRSVDVDMRSDIYSFGCMLYEMLTGQTIFSVKKFEAWLHVHLEEAPTLAALPTDQPELRDLLRACLEKDPAKRPATWSEVADRLTDIYTRVTGLPPVLEIT
ncbi:MAG: serine/threonine protein kinase, partial [Anaerolineae bacterium]|nr:serine/threonine protein kinase [Anaerolineae bacterium]